MQSRILSYFIIYLYFITQYIKITYTIKNITIRVIEKKYFDKLVERIKELEEENRKLNQILNKINKTNYPIINWKEKHNGRNLERH